MYKTVTLFTQDPQSFSFRLPYLVLHQRHQDYDIKRHCKAHDMYAEYKKLLNDSTYRC